MTYEQFKVAVFKLMFDYSNKGKVQIRDANNTDAMLHMAEAITYAQNDMARVSPIIKQYSIIQNPPPLCVDDASAFGAFKTVQHVSSDIVYDFPAAKAVYFEVEGPGTITVEERDGKTETINNTAKGRYTEYKRLVNGARISFTGEYIYNIRNAMGYRAKYETPEDIVAFREHMKYDLSTLTKNEGRTTFLRLNEKPLIYQGGGGYDDSPAFYFEGNSTLVLGFFERGEFIVQYDYLPRQISEKTPDDYELEYPDDINSIMVYYAASRIAMDSDKNLSVLYNNIYEDRKGELLNFPQRAEQEEFISVTGY